MDVCISAHGAARRAGVNTQHMKTREFMKRFAELPASTTQSGYNPLLRDFTNTSFFVGQRA